MIFLYKALISVLLLGVLIFIHELGHFLVAKMCGVGVLRFSIGFGPILLKFRIGETRYQLCAIPLGGYVRMLGDMPDALTGEQKTDEQVREMLDDEELDEASRLARSDKSRWFIEKNLWQKSLIVFAGPLFNFLLAIVFIAIGAYFYSEKSADPRAIIGEVIKAAPAASAGVLEGGYYFKCQRPRCFFLG